MTIRERKVKSNFKQNMVSRASFIFSIFLAFLPHGIAATPASCCSVCECRAQEVWCEERGLTSVPVDIPSQIKRLYLFNNNISFIPDESLANLKYLELLDLRSNQLTTSSLKPKIFQGLNQLQDLLLSDNKISRIDQSTFSGMSRLVRLYLEKNNLEEIGEGALSNLPNLLELKLSQNLLTSFPQIVNCTSLRRLQINENHLIRLQPNVLSHLNLEELALSGNRLNQLPSLVFKHVTNMREVDLSRNRISRIPRVISKMSSLRTLNLSGNPISSFPRDFLSNLRRMKVLDLSNMHLTTLEKGFIPRRVYLNIFGLSQNPWVCDCSMSWLIEYMKILSGVFVRMSQIQCDAPAQLRGRQLSTLLQIDLNCDRLATQDSGDEKKAPPSAADVNEACRDVVCANGGECVLDGDLSSPSCRCTPEWSGESCDERKSQSTESNSMGNLMIEPGSLTSHSVRIILPHTDEQIKITATEITDQGTGWSSTQYFYLTSNIYTVDNLKSATPYRICISSTPDSFDYESVSSDDVLCVKVKTNSLSNVVVENKDSNEPEFDGNTDLSDFEGAAERGDKGKDKEFDLLYPIIGACAAVFIIMMCSVFLFSYRRKKRKFEDASNCEDARNSSHPRNEKLLQLTLEQAQPMMDPETTYKLSPNNLSSPYPDDDTYNLNKNPFYTCPGREDNVGYNSLCKCSPMKEEKLNYEPTVVLEKNNLPSHESGLINKSQLYRPMFTPNQAGVCNQLRSQSPPSQLPMNNRDYDSVSRYPTHSSNQAVNYSKYSSNHSPSTPGFEPASFVSPVGVNLVDSHQMYVKVAPNETSQNGGNFSPSSNLLLQKQLSDKNFYLNCELHNQKLRSAKAPSVYADTRRTATVNTMII